MLTSKNAIKKLSIKLGKYYGQWISTTEALKKLKGAWKESRAAKKIANTLRKAFQEELIAKKAIDLKNTPDQLQKMTIREERAIKEGKDSR